MCISWGFCIWKSTWFCLFRIAYINVNLNYICTNKSQRKIKTGRDDKEELFTDLFAFAFSGRMLCGCSLLIVVDYSEMRSLFAVPWLFYHANAAKQTESCHQGELIKQTNLKVQQQTKSKQKTGTGAEREGNKEFSSFFLNISTPSHFYSIHN